MSPPVYPIIQLFISLCTATYPVHRPPRLLSPLASPHLPRLFTSRRSHRSPYALTTTRHLPPWSERRCVCDEDGRTLIEEPLALVLVPRVEG